MASAPLHYVDDNDGVVFVDYCLYSFKHRDIVLEMIKSLPLICRDRMKCERTLEQLIVIIDRYQEQPHLLDPDMETLFSNLLDPIVDDENCPSELVNISFSCLHPLIKVRGYKRALRYFPHDVTHLERVLSLLESQDQSNADTWATRYCLLLWLSVVAIVPFDLSRFARADSATKEKFLFRLIDVGKIYLTSTDSCQAASAVYLSKLFDRFDAKKDCLASFIDWACDRIKSQAEPSSKDLPKRFLYGVLRVLGLLFKHGARADFLPYAPKVFDTLNEMPFFHASDTLIRKLWCKLLQRLCLVFMKKSVQSWRYERGRRVLGQTVATDDSSGAKSLQSENKSLRAEETSGSMLPDAESLPYLEKTISMMTGSLGDKDGVVRWSAAKALARICARLPVEMAEQVIKRVLALFSVRLSAGGWHGASLVLAEFARRGLLRHTQLEHVVPLVSQACFYDETQGSYALGAHVRDAACYMCWAFARAYRPADLAPFVRDLAADLVVVMLFDREIQVRRAAAAAFQENVGRQGTFHLGIDILSICDFFAVGNIRTCYLELAPTVAALGDSNEYLEPLFDHLVELKLGHWDMEVRELASKSIAKLLLLSGDNDQCHSLVQSLLHELITTIDQNRAHGLSLALTESLPLLALKDDENKIPKLLANFFKGLGDRTISKGLKGEIVRHAICGFIASVCRSNLTVSQELIDLWLKLLTDYFREFEVTLYDSAANAVNDLLTRSLDFPDCSANAVIDSWVEEIKITSFPQTRSAFIKAISQLPPHFMNARKTSVVLLLVQSCSIEETTRLWADSRISALRAINSLFDTLKLEDFSKEMIDSLILSCITCLEDYTSDERGDIAAGVREQSALTLMHSLIRFAKAESLSRLSSEHIVQTMSILAGQSCEKISRTRLNAIHCLLSVIRFEETPITAVPRRSELLAHFENLPLPPAAAVICNSMPEWTETVTFMRFSKLLEFSEYRESVLRGLLLSCGDLTESLSQAAYDALSNYILHLGPGEIRDMFAAILSLLANAQKSQESLARLATPIVKSIDSLMTCGVFDDILEQQSLDNDDELLSKLYSILKALSRSKNFQRVNAVAKLLCSLLALPMNCPLSNHPATRLIVILLVHPYPRVRSQTASALFEAVSLSPPSECDVDAVYRILSGSDWSNKAEAMKAHDELCKIINVEPGKILK